MEAAAAASNLNTNNMKLIYYFPLIALIFLNTNCKWFDNNDSPKKYGKLNIVWRTSFKDGGTFGSEAPAIFNNKVVFSNYSSFQPESFFALNADDGKTQYWSWEDYISNTTTSVGGKELPITFGKVLCLPLANGALGIDMNDGKTLWKNSFSAPGYHSVFERCIIKEGYKSGDNKHQSYLKIIDIESGNDRVVFQIDTITTPFSGFSGVLANRTVNNDTLLYFTFFELFQQPDGSLNNYSWLYAYNLSQNKIVWSHPNIYTAWPPISTNGKLFVVSSGYLFCFDAETGNEIWKQQMHVNSGGYFKLFDNKLVISDQGGTSFVHAYNLSDGSPAWKISYNGNSSEPVYYKGLMYFTCGSDGLLWAIRVSNGEIVWKERCPDQDENDISYWSFGVNVDPVRNKLYVASFTGAFCLEPAE
jgi:outer membrane protein assembly factor BamB